MKKTLICFKIR